MGSPRNGPLTPSATSGASASRVLSDAGGITLPHVAVMNLIAPDSPETRFRSASRSPELQNVNVQSNPDPFMDLLFSGWNPDLPDPATLNH